MTIMPAFTLCFLFNGDDILMLHRRFPPNQGLWNGVGGHIEPGETATEAVIREVAEETGYRIESADFAGLLTWDGFEIPSGAIAIFTAQVPHRNFVTNHEGELAWQPREWVCTAPEVVDNIHVFLPKMLEGERPMHFHFSYRDGKRIRDQVEPIPADFDLERPFRPEMGPLEEERGEYLLSFDQDRLQLDRVEDFLVKGCYWAKDRSREVIVTSIQNSVCLGIYREGFQVAFARLVTDRATFAWLCDVYVEDAQRGHNLGKWLVEAACRYSDQMGISLTLLATRDAHGLYAGYGQFRPLDVPGKWMRRDLQQKN